MLVTSINKTLDELRSLLMQLSATDYASPCKNLSNSTIGEHTRHIIEMFQCLENQYEYGIVNYDNRKRDYMIQTDTEFAKNAIESVIENLNKPNKKIVLHQIIDGEDLCSVEDVKSFHAELQAARGGEGRRRVCDRPNAVRQGEGQDGERPRRVDDHRQGARHLHHRRG